MLMCSGITEHNKSYSPAVMIFNIESSFFQLVVCKQVKIFWECWKTKDRNSRWTAL